MSAGFYLQGHKEAIFFTPKLNIFNMLAPPGLKMEAGRFARVRLQQIGGIYG